MYPVLFEVFGYPISTFGLMLASAFLVGTWIAAYRMQELGLDAEKASTILIYIMIGGIGGSKLYFAIDMTIRSGSPISQFLFARDGITWYGGLIGGTLFGILGSWIHGLPIKKMADCVANAGPVGQALGRIGCFLVGDDYGKPTDHAWGIAFPEGAPPTFQKVHPTQLYEVAWLVPVAIFLWLRRKRSPFLFGEFIALNGAGRIVIEHWRVNPRVAMGLTEPQWIGSGLILIGVGSWFYYRAKERREAAAPA